MIYNPRMTSLPSSVDGYQTSVANLCVTLVFLGLAATVRVGL